MLRFLIHLMTLGGCILSLVSFCLFLYLVVPYSGVSFTGLQLMQLGPQIPLTDQEIYEHVIQSPHIYEVLQNVSFIRTQFGLSVLLLLVVSAVVLLSLNPRLHQLVRQGGMW